MKGIATAVIAALVTITGCATKNYGRQGELTGYERDTMNCREIDLEVAKVHGFLKHVDKESQFDGRSVLSFLGDFGVGNLMEKTNAVDSATTRLAQLQELRSRRGCGAVAARTDHRTSRPESSIALAAASPTPAKHIVGRFSYSAEQLPEVRSCNPYPVASLTAQGPGFENFSVVCTNGDAVSVRCESIGCRVLK